MGMGGPSRKEKPQRQPSCSGGELSFPGEECSGPAILRNSLLRGFAGVAHKFNPQFSCCQQLQEQPTPAQAGRMGSCGHEHSASELWVTAGGQGTAGTQSRGDLGAGAGPERTHLCATTQKGFLMEMRPSEASKDQTCVLR